MSTSAYYVHNLSPFIFTVSGLKLGWMSTVMGSAVLTVLLLLGIGGLWGLPRAREFSETQLSRIYFLRPIFILIAVVITALFGLHKAGIDWGLRWYSTMYLLGYTICYLWCRHWIKKRAIMLTPLLLDSLIAYLMLGMILGARTAYVFIYNWDAYSQRPADIIKVWEGGLSFHGGIVGVIAAIVIFCRQHKISFWHLSDRLSLTVPVGIGLGRIGNFMNGELYGRVISDHVPWAVIFPGGGDLPRHPSQIYQSLGEGWLLFITLLLINRKKHKEGTIGAAFIFFYGIYRFFMEYFREADEQLKYYFNNSMTMGQILCVLTSLAGVAVYFMTRDTLTTDTEAWQQRNDAFLAQRAQVENET
ncbi:prolipoprotein diacylglyceryl transferase [bacterium]|nr:prolipoprotein diacylglyceryl transferase [bacterium]